MLRDAFHEVQDSGFNQDFGTAKAGRCIFPCPILAPMLSLKTKQPHPSIQNKTVKRRPSNISSALSIFFFHKPPRRRAGMGASFCQHRTSKKAPQPLMHKGLRGFSFSFSPKQTEKSPAEIGQNWLSGGATGGASLPLPRSPFFPQPVQAAARPAAEKPHQHAAEHIAGKVDANV